MKKKFVFLGFLTLLLSVYLFSCQKEEALTETTITEKNEQVVNNSDEGTVGTREITPLNYADCPNLLGLITKTNGRLVFQDEEHFEKCAFCLEHQYDVYNDAFDALYPNATAEQLDSYADLMNFNEWGSYISFESGLGFSSLRAKIQTESDAFLASTPAATIDLDLDPDGLCPVLRDSERALLNEDGEAMVGNVLKTEEDWTEKSFWDDCGFLLERSEKYTESNNSVLVDRELKVWIRVESGIIFSTLFGKMKHYKKNSNNRFRPERADMRIRVTGDAFDADCGSTAQIWNGGKGWKKRKQLFVTAYTPAMLWREAFVDGEDPKWSEKASSVNAELFSNMNLFTFGLAR
jgi:hypothetical protein